jgi:Transposase DDE domain
LRPSSAKRRPRQTQKLRVEWDGLVAQARAASARLGAARAGSEAEVRASEASLDDCARHILADAMRERRETVEHPFGTMKMRMGATHFLCKTLPKVATEIALCVLTYNLTRVLNIVEVEKLIEAITA